MATQLISFDKNPNIGLYVYTTDDYALVGREVPQKVLDEIKKVLNVPLHQISIAGTSLIGVFLNGNSKTLLVPSIAFDHELEKLDKLNISYKVFDTDLTCLGNNILINDNGVVASSDFSKKDIYRIKELTGMDVVVSDVADTHTPGSCVHVRNEIGIIHRDASKTQIELIQSTLNITLTPTTVNMGSPYVSSGVASNEYGLLIGDASGPAEITYIESGLGFVEG